MPATKTQRERAYFVPFMAFILLMMVGQGIPTLFKGQSWLPTDTQYWVIPAQALVCGALVLFYWPQYEFGKAFRTSTLLLGLGVGILAFALWISPQFLFPNAPKRLEGFNPAYFSDIGWPYWLNVIVRFVRLVVVVPLVEEIFWRGFLMRWIIHEDFTAVPFGTFQLKGFILVALLFMLVHNSIDYPAAFLTGLLYNWVAVRTKHLGACVLAHAVTNLLLGIYIMRTEQWGFW